MISVQSSPYLEKLKKKDEGELADCNKLSTVPLRKITSEYKGPIKHEKHFSQIALPNKGNRHLDYMKLSFSNIEERLIKTNDPLLESLLKSQLNSLDAKHSKKKERQRFLLKKNESLYNRIMENNQKILNLSEYVDSLKMTASKFPISPKSSNSNVKMRSSTIVKAQSFFNLPEGSRNAYKEHISEDELRKILEDTSEWNAQMARNQHEIKDEGEKMLGLKAEINRIQKILFVYYQSLIERGIDVRLDGIHCIFKDVWKLGYKVDTNKVCKIFDQDSIKYVNSLAKLEFKIEKLAISKSKCFSKKNDDSPRSKDESTPVK